MKGRLFNHVIFKSETKYFEFSEGEGEDTVEQLYRSDTNRGRPCYSKTLQSASATKS